MAEVRIQKILAGAGFGARRRCETLIAEGRVTVNGAAVTEPGAKADPARDVIEVGGARVQLEEKVYVIFNKPPDCITTMKDPQGRRTIVEYLRGIPRRVFPVGRLDRDTEGLLLLTNDGAFAQRVAHPSNEVTKTYEALVSGVPSEGQLETLRAGVVVDGLPTAPAVVKILETREAETPVKNRKGAKTRKFSAALLEIRIHEGRKRQVRKMVKAVGFRVLSLKRTRVGGLTLGNLPPGGHRYLDRNEMEMIFVGNGQDSQD